jgi:Archaeal phage integrase
LKRRLELSSNLEKVAGGERFEPSTPNLGVGFPIGFSIDNFKVFIQGKYCHSYANQILNFVQKYPEYLDNPSLMLSLKPSVRCNALKSMVALSKYVGCYESYKSKLKSYGIKWSNEDTAFNGFLSIFSKNHDTLGTWVKQIQPLTSNSEKLFLRFLAATGLRRTEVITSFNMVIDLSTDGKLGDYYNPELRVLEHYKYKVFLRGTKNAYISFVPKELIEQICLSQKISYYAFHSRLNRKHIPLRFKEFRSYHNSYLRKQGIISELVDVLAGRVPKTVFARHYLGEDMKTFSNQVLEIEMSLEKTLLS